MKANWYELPKSQVFSLTWFFTNGGFMNFITERIAIGNRHEAKDLELLLSKDIDAVLNLAYDLDISYFEFYHEYEYKFPIEYQKVGLIDGEGNKLTTFAAAVYMLDQLLERHDKVLVHCHAGVSRSASVVATYISHKNGISFEGALDWVKKKRPEIYPSSHLIKIAKSLTNLFEKCPKLKP